MDYFKHYNLLIQKAKTRQLECYTESHHIIPKCMGGSNNHENLVDLTPEEHYLAHQLLTKMYPKNYGLLSAAMMMTANRRGNKVYGWLRKKWSQKMRENNPLKNNPSSNARKGRRIKGTFSEDEKQAISERMKKNNPMANVKPWEHSRATNKTREEWAKADIYFEWWKNTKKSYHSMSKHFGFNKPMMTHHNMVDMFRAGWIPHEDYDWREFKCKI